MSAVYQLLVLGLLVSDLAVRVRWFVFYNDRQPGLVENVSSEFFVLWSYFFGIRNFFSILL